MLTIEYWVDQLRDALERGQVLDFAPGVSDQEVLASDATAWPADRDMPAEAVRQVLLDSTVRPDPRGLRIRAARVTGTVDLSHVAVVFPMGFLHCIFEEEVVASYLRAPMLDLTGVRVPGIDLALARFDGDLILRDAHLTKKKAGDALTFRGGDVGGGVYAERLRATGLVRVTRATINGALVLDGAQLTNEGGTALGLARTTVRGGVYLNGVTARGGLDATELTINGQLVLDDANLTGDGQDPLSLDGATVTGGVFANRLHATGKVRALGARTASQFVLQGAVLINDGDTALSLLGAIIESEFHLNPAYVRGDIVLAFASIARLLVADSAVISLLESPIIAAGWRLGDVNGWLLTERVAARDWLDHGAEEFGFIAQPWHELASVYERHGRLADARWLRYQAAKRTSKSGPRPSRWLGFLYNIFAGHGYYPLIAGFWLVAALLLSWGLVFSSEGSFTPTNPAAAAQPGPRAAIPASQITGAASCRDLASNYPCFNPALYALDTMLPVGINTGESTAWRPIATHAIAVSVSLAIALNVLKVFTWLMAALLVAGVTGLLRRT